ncbi:hypothetical protein Pflav_005600 [Phytohabitans flavus]|uniref:Uncharacterized protein n=1 Tax=Phytohabitans flavus TaxID=1076124 RepID=A0A6F8XK12_9ACTN|nr:hypothetical protein [Phytohabitans flavus]BCB74150.1 hypothetical protein Pflav_005600 [Phytohabitans flavus]
MSTDLTVTGKPAQLDRGVIADVGGRLTSQFADRLAAELVAPAPTVALLVQDEPAAPETQPETEVEPIDMLKLSVGTAAARYAGLIAISAGAVVLTWLVIRALRR